MDTQTTTEFQPPATNTADAWNAVLVDVAKKEGITLPWQTPAEPVAADPVTPAAPAVPATTEEEVLYQFPVTVNGKEIMLQDKDPVNLLKQVAAAQEAAAPATVETPAAETPKPGLTEEQLLDVRLKLSQGDPTALDTYIENSGIIDRYLESKGLNVGDLKAATERNQSRELNDQWKEATDQFAVKVRSGEIDYPGGEQNTYLMGLMLAELGLRNKPSVESFEMAYSELKKRNLVFPVTAPAAPAPAPVATPTPASAVPETPARRPAPASSAVGSAGGQEVRGAGVDHSKKYELDLTKLTPHQYTASYNDLLRAGVKPENIVVKQ